jgi:Mg2+ and Co2+ transporter CorA
MQMLIQFVKSFENFMVWIKQQPAESEESIRRFEDIFNVTEQTHLLRNIQDIKDELCMLEAVFQDQMDVLCAAGKEINKANFHCVDGCEVDEAVRQSIRCPHSSMVFVDQSMKHWKQIRRMQAQADQAYDTVRFLIMSPPIQIKRRLTSPQLKDLLNLKQQQANVLEARVSRNQAISSGEQSKTIMVFTIVTIIFVRPFRHR